MVPGDVGGGALIGELTVSGGRGHVTSIRAAIISQALKLSDDFTPDSASGPFGPEALLGEQLKGCLDLIALKLNLALFDGATAADTAFELFEQ